MNEEIDVATLAEHLDELDLIRATNQVDGLKEIAAHARRTMKAERTTILGDILQHEGMTALLAAMGSQLIHKTSKKVIRGVPKRDELHQLRTTLSKVEQWIRWQMIVPSPIHHPKHEANYVADLKQYRPGGKLPKLPPMLPQTVYVVDFDENRGAGRSLDDLLGMVTGDGYEPLCAAPSASEGNYHFWFTLEEQTWWRLRPPKHWEADKGYRRGVLGWNPIYRHYHPNRRGELTWWNDAARPTPVELFTLGGQENDFPWVDEYERVGGSRDGRHYTTAQLGDLLRRTCAGQGERHDNLMRYVAHHQARAADALGHHPDLDEHRRIAFEGNGLFAEPQPIGEVEFIARWYWRNPFYQLQRNRRARGKILRVGEVFECLDALMTLRICAGLKPEMPPEGLRKRWGEPNDHPQWERYRKHLYFGKPGTTKHLADVDERWTEAAVNKWLSLYRRTYENNPHMNENDGAWKMNLNDWMRMPEGA